MDSADEDSALDSALGSTTHAMMDVEAQEVGKKLLMERIDVEKENGTVNPADRDVGAANLKVERGPGGDHKSRFMIFGFHSSVQICTRRVQRSLHEEEHQTCALLAPCGVSFPAVIVRHGRPR